MFSIMKTLISCLAFGVLSLSGSMVCKAQKQSTSTAVTRVSGAKVSDNKSASGESASGRLQNRLQRNDPSDADLAWRKIVYRKLDLEKSANAPLGYYEPDGGCDDLFRIILKLLCEGKISGYEFVDGRESFTDRYKVKMRDIFDRFDIAYSDAKGSTEKRPRFVVDDELVPSDEVLSYYIIERWDFDRRINKLRPTVEALCPVLHRMREFGSDTLTTPMFWVKLDDLRPYLSNHIIPIDDDNNMLTGTYDDYFSMNLYDGEIYKTRNLSNKSLIDLYPDEKDRKKAADSIDNRLASFDTGIWVPSLDELNPKSDSIAENGTVKSEPKASVKKASNAKPKSRSIKSKRGSKPASSSSSGGVLRSVRNRKR